MGRSLANNILNLMRSDVFRNVLNEFGVNVDDITRHEPDAGLGNGGLGRLAACFMDSLTTMELPAVEAQYVMSTDYLSGSLEAACRLKSPTGGER